MDNINMKDNKYITVLDFEVGRIFQYELKEPLVSPLHCVWLIPRNETHITPIIILFFNILLIFYVIKFHY